MICVYGCIVGGYDDPLWLLRSQPQQPRSCRWRLFVDPPWLEKTRALARSLPCPPYPCWEIHPTAEEWDPVRTARYHKANPQQILPAETTVSIWLDGTQQIRPGTDLQVFVPETPIATFCHPDRDCIYQEMRFCCARKKDEAKVMAAQVAKYRAAGYPTRYGLAETSCVVRHHTPEVRAFDQDWWTEIRQGSRRDQLSFDYVCWARKLRYSWLPGCRDRSPYLRYRPHAG